MYIPKRGVPLFLHLTHMDTNTFGDDEDGFLIIFFIEKQKNDVSQV